MAGIAPRHQREDFPPHPDDPFLAVRSLVLYQITVVGARGKIRFLQFCNFSNLEGGRDLVYICKIMVRTKSHRRFASRPPPQAEVINLGASRPQQKEGTRPQGRVLSLSYISLRLSFFKTFRLKSRGPPKNRVSDWVILRPLISRSSMSRTVQTRSAS